MASITDLRPGKVAIDQREFSLADGSQDLLLFYGIRVAGLRCNRDNLEEFRSRAALLMQLLVEEFKVEVLTGFRYRLMMAWPCSNRAEAKSMFLKLLPKEAIEKLQQGLGDYEPLSVELGLKKGPILSTTRHSIVDLPPAHGSGSPDTGSIPHVLVSVLTEGVQPLTPQGLDVPALIENIETRLAPELLNKVNSDLHALPV